MRFRTIETDNDCIDKEVAENSRLKIKDARPVPYVSIL